jgi:hypothetical protein
LENRWHDSGEAEHDRFESLKQALAHARTLVSTVSGENQHMMKSADNVYRDSRWRHH